MQTIDYFFPPNKELKSPPIPPPPPPNPTLKPPALPPLTNDFLKQ